MRKFTNFTIAEQTTGLYWVPLLMFPRARSAMNWTCKLLAVVLATVAFFSWDLHAQSTAATELNLGVEAFKLSNYAEAIQHLEKAVSLDPENQDAPLYLANAYANQFKPGVHTPENTRLAEQAIEQYQHVLDSAPNPASRIDSAKGIAKLYLQMQKFDDSKKYFQMASDLDPKDPEPYLGIASVDFWECGGPQALTAGLRLSLIPNTAKTPDQKKACDELKAKNMPAIKEGIDSLNKAMKLRPDYPDAMQMMQMLYMAKAATECDDPTAREEDAKTEKAWFDKEQFGVPVKARNSPVGDFDRQLYPACQSPSGESSGSGEPYDIAEAYEVYSAIIPTVAPDRETHMWFIRIDTVTNGAGSSRPVDPARAEGEQSRGQRLVDTGLDDYFKMNARTWLLQRNFTLPNPYKLVASDAPDSKEGFIELSAVGFNTDKTVAVVYMGHQCGGPPCGGGKSFVLQKHNGKWEVLSGLSCWMS